MEGKERKVNTERVPATNAKKVTNVMGTFLKKVTDTVGTFLNRDRECINFIIIPFLVCENRFSYLKNFVCQNEGITKNNCLIYATHESYFASYS